MDWGVTKKDKEKPLTTFRYQRFFKRLNGGRRTNLTYDISTLTMVKLFQV